MVETMKDYEKNVIKWSSYRRKILILFKNTFSVLPAFLSIFMKNKKNKNLSTIF